MRISDWSSDVCSSDLTFYFNDSACGEIRVYDYNQSLGSISNPRVHVQVDTRGGGGPDGSTVDADGYLWNVLVYEGKVVRYAPDGAIDRVLDMPVKKVTSVMFGGPDLDVL